MDLLYFAKGNSDGAGHTIEGLSFETLALEQSVLSYSLRTRLTTIKSAFQIFRMIA